jgi:dolichyl-phosphate beta-glucosyltransferase
VVVDDGSKDKTAEIAALALAGRRGRVLGGEGNRGKGYAVRRGVLAAEGRLVLITDADLSTPIEEYDTLAAAARARRLQVAIGSRALDTSRIEVRQNPLRQLMGKAFNRIMRGMTGLPFHDTQCGFKLLDRAATLPIVRRMVVDRFAFDVELLFLCVRAGLRVEEVPVVWRNAPGSKVSLLGDPANMLWDVARMRWRYRRGLYGAP